MAGFGRVLGMLNWPVLFGVLIQLVPIGTAVAHAASAAHSTARK